jgi:hypothetical protein
MSKKILCTAVAATASVGGLGVYSLSASAAGDCTIVGGVVNITGTGDAGADLCNIDNSVTTINYNGTIAEFGTILNAYNLAGWGSTDGLIDINAVISDEFGSEQLTWIGGLTANITDTATIAITPTVKDITYTAVPYTMPTGIALDFSDVVIHIPDTTGVTDAADLFRDIADGSVIVAAGNNYTISEESDLPTVHMPEGTSLADLVALAGTLGADMIVAENGANNPVVVNDAADDMTIYLPTGTTLAEALALLNGLDVDATVAVIGSDEFTITLAVGEEPVINMTQSGVDVEIKAPTSGAFTFESQGLTANLLPTMLIAAMAAGAVVFARKKAKASEQ